MRIHIVLPFVLATLAISACGQGTVPTIAGLGGGTSSGGSNLGTLSISPSQLSAFVGSTFQFSTNAPSSLQSQVQWSSSQTTVASVSPSGLMTALAPGSTIITARYASDTTVSSRATVVVQGIATP